MRQDIYNKIRVIKKQYEVEGFIIIGVFGSFARGDETDMSDVDILYEFHEPFISRYRGWETYGRLETRSTGLVVWFDKLTNRAVEPWCTCPELAEG